MAALPIRFTVCTYNIWTHTRWPERRAALQAFVRMHMPDILCLQEVQPDSRAALDEVLAATHARVDDPFEGWTQEGNLYWNRDLFEMVEYGVEDINICEPLRRMFWAQLRLNDGSGRTLFVSTAHLTYDGHTEIVSSEKMLRMGQARAAVAALDRLRHPDEPQLFMGDMNDQFHVIRILGEAGFVDCFRAMGRLPRFTHPAAPTAVGMPCTIDWLMQRGSLRAMNAEVPDFYDGDLAPSDHKPVLATYGWA